MEERNTNPQGGGLSERAMEPATEGGPLSGTGGGAGGGTRAGEGQPSGEDTDHPQTIKNEPAIDEQSVRASVSERGAMFGATGDLAGRAGTLEAAEAAALGDSPGSLADEAEALRRQAPPAGGGTIGDALKSGEEPQVGSGTPPDRGELGGGVPKAESGSTGPAGTRSPGGESRK